MRVSAALDTNALVSGLMIADGPPRQIVDAWLTACFDLVTSLYLMDELAQVLSYPGIAERLRLDEGELNAILAALLSRAKVTPGEPRLPGVARDPKDDAVVACAVEGRADYIVTGDQDLLALGEHQGIRVVTPRRFLGILGL